MLILFFLSSFFSFSQQNDTINISRELKEVVITGQIIKKNKAKTLQRIRLIDASKLETGMFNSLSEVLQYESNIQIREDNVLGSSVRIQGMSGENVKVLIDDMPIIGRLNGNIDLSQINLSNVEQIEIVEGPLSVSYGTNALAGTINIITKKEFTKNVNVNFNTFYETVGRYNVDLFFGYQLKNNTFSFEGVRNYFSGWSENDKFSLIPREEIADTNRFKSWKPKEQIYSKLQHYFKNQQFTSRTYLNYFSEKVTNRDRPDKPYYDIAFDEYYHTNRINFGSDISYLKDGKKIDLLLGVNNYKRFKNTFRKNLISLEEKLSQDPSSHDTTFFNLTKLKMMFSSIKNKKFTYQAGFDFENESAKGKRISDGSKEIQSDYALFSNLEWVISNTFTIRPGIRFIYNTDYNAPITPALHSLYNYNKNVTIRASYSKGFRSPSLKELYHYFVDQSHTILGNTELMSENSSNYQLSMEIITKKTHPIKLDISTYYNVVRNKINLTYTNPNPDDNEMTYFNIGSQKNIGASLNVNYSRNNFIANFGNSYVGFENNISNKDYENDLIDRFNFNIESSANLIYNLKKNKLQFNLFYKYSGLQNMFYLDVDGGVQENRMEAYNLLNFSINKQLLDKKITLILGAKNLLDVITVRTSGYSSTHSSSNSSVSVGYGRTFFINLKYRL